MAALSIDDADVHYTKLLNDSYKTPADVRQRLIDIYSVGQ